MSKVKIEITENFDIFVSTNEKGQRSKKKLIDLKTLHNMLDTCVNGGKPKQQKEVKKDERKILYSSPLYPSFNGVSILQHIIKNKDQEFVVLHREARPSRVAFYDEVLDNVGMPSLLFFVNLFNGRIQDARVMAIKDKIPTEDSKMCIYPLTNVGEYGNVCFGQNQLREYKIEHFGELLSFPNMFLMMPATNELASPRTGYDIQLRPLLNHLKGKEFDSLKLIETNLTYKKYVKKYLYGEGEK